MTPDRGEDEGRRGVSAVGGIMRALFVIGGLVGIGYAVYWAYVRDQAQSIVTAYIEDMRASGYRVGFADSRTGGHPLRVDMTFAAPSIGSPPWMQEWMWTAERLRVSALPMDVNRVEFAPDGLQTVAVPGSELIDVVSDGAAASLAGDAAGIADVQVRSGAMVARGAQSRDVVARADAIDARLRRDPETPDDLIAASTIAGLDAGAAHAAGAAGLGPLDISLNARVRQGAVIAAAGVLAEPVLAEWARRDGAVEIQSARLDWPDAAVEVTGELGLNRAGLWRGALEVEMREPAKVVERLVAAGLIDPRAAQAMTGMATTAAGEDGVMRAAFRVRDGQVFVLGLPVVQLPRAY